MGKLIRTFLLVALLAAVTIQQAPAETFSFRSEVTPRNQSATIGGELTFPPGPGPHPLVIFLHACAGMDRFTQASLARYGQLLRKSGFGIYALDSFTARKLAGGQVCDPNQLRPDTGWFRVDDVFNAVQALRKHPKVDSGNLFLLGESHGALVALLAARDRPERGKLQAIAAFYPSCRPLLSTNRLNVPVIVFAAGKDDWTPAAPCIEAKKIDRMPGEEFELVVYPDAHHSFDVVRATVSKFMGFTSAYDPRASADSQKRMLEFFAKYLRR